MSDYFTFGQAKNRIEKPFGAQSATVDADFRVMTRHDAFVHASLPPHIRGGRRDAVFASRLFVGSQFVEGHFSRETSGKPYCGARLTYYIVVEKKSSPSSP